MFVLQVQLLIEALSEEKNLSSMDSICLEKLKGYKDRDSAANLNNFDIAILSSIFKERLSSILDTDLDYTKTRAGVNAAWITLAESLALHLNVSCLNILYPDLQSTLDPNQIGIHIHIEDLSNCILTEDRKYLLHVNGFIERFKRANRAIDLQTHDSHHTGKGKLRPLTLMELRRASPITHDFFTQQKCKDFKQYLNTIFFADRVYPFLTADVLEILLDIFTAYLLWGTEPEEVFKEKLTNQLIKLNKTKTAPFVNQVYGSKFKYTDGGKELSAFLWDFFQECLVSKDKDRLNAKASGFMSWLSEQYASSSTKYSEADKYSDTLKTEVVNLLSGIYVGCSFKLKQEIVEIRAKVKKSGLSDTITAEIRNIFALRWEQIKAKDTNYTSKPDGVNRPAERLARVLCATGWLKRDPYAELMPDLEVECDAVTLSPISEIPLHELILSEDGKQLISVRNCIQHYKIHGTFCTPDIQGNQRSLTKVERERWAYTDKKFHSYMDKLTEDLFANDPAISLETIARVKTLVQGCFYPLGLQGGKNYSEKQLEDAHNSIVKFLVFYENMPDAERKNLDAQHMLVDNKVLKFSEVLSALLSAKPTPEDVEIMPDDLRKQFKAENLKVCTAIYSKWLLQLVWDYAPWEIFSREIMDRERVTKESSESRHRKIPAEYAHLKDKPGPVERRLRAILQETTQHTTFAHIQGTIKAVFQKKNKTDINLLETYIEVIEAQIYPLYHNEKREKRGAMGWLRTSDRLNALSKIIEQHKEFMDYMNTASSGVRSSGLPPRSVAINIRSPRKAMGADGEGSGSKYSASI